jgi:hypothetical protein
MKPPSGENWAEVLDQELRKLPDHEAPPTLIPRVMAALHAKGRLPWWRRGWWHWPPAAQIVVLLVFSGLLGVLTYYATWGWDGAFLAQASRKLGEWLAPLEPTWRALSALLRAFDLVFRKFGQWLPLVGAALCLAMYFSCIGLGTAAYRLAARRA